MLRRNLLKSLLVAPFAFLGKNDKASTKKEIRAGDRVTVNAYRMLYQSKRPYRKPLAGMKADYKKEWIVGKAIVTRKSELATVTRENGKIVDVKIDSCYEIRMDDNAKYPFGNTEYKKPVPLKIWTVTESEVTLIT